MSAKVLTRQAEFTATTRASGDGSEGDGLTLEGYAAVFGVPTRIDSWEGTFDESIRKGAFRKTLRETTPVMQFDHGRHPLIGSIPIGNYDSLSEDDEGLYVLGRISDNWLIDPVRDAIARKAVKGMSFRFEVVRDEWRDNTGTVIKPDDDEFWRILWKGEQHERGPLARDLIEVKMPEAGPVVFPAYTQTSVALRAAEIARSVLEDEDLVHEVRSALARGPLMDDVGLPADPDLRRDVARAVLFGTRPGAARGSVLVGAPRAAADLIRTGPDRPATSERLDAPPTGHPSTQVDPAGVPAGKRRSTDAPPTGHPSAGDPATDGRDSQNDAPPAAGHPSTPLDRAARMKVRRDLYLTLNGVGKYGD